MLSLSLFPRVKYLADISVCIFVSDLEPYCSCLICTVIFSYIFQTRMKSVIAPVASDVNPFYDSAKRTNYRSFYGPQFPNVASKSAPLGIYNSDTGSVESLFKGELKLHMCILFLNSFDFALNLKKISLFMLCDGHCTKKSK